jgi:hypothetical protein
LEGISLGLGKGISRHLALFLSSLQQHPRSEGVQSGHSRSPVLPPTPPPLTVGEQKEEEEGVALKRSVAEEEEEKEKK